jgi:MTH538 TIR-like domain (DUF1863)
LRRRVFISYQHQDQMKAKGLNLMTYNQDLDVTFIGRHLLDPVSSDDPDYISRKIREQINGSSATIVLIGNQTADSGWVPKEVQWSLDKEPPNGLLGIRIDPNAEIPAQLTQAGAEILDWNAPEDVYEFDAAIERAIAATSRGRNMPVNSVSTCAR